MNIGMSAPTLSTTAPQKIQSFTDLNAWKKGHVLVLMIYKITKNFLKEELYGLTDQIRRAAVSITSNIAEGFSRTSYKEKTQFYATAMGSLTEVQSQLMIAKDIGYVPEEAFTEIMDQATTVSNILGGLIKNSKIRSS